MNLTWIENTLIFALNSYVDKKLKYHRPIGALDVSHFSASFQCICSLDFTFPSA